MLKFKAEFKETSQLFQVKFSDTNQSFKVMPEIGQTVIERNIYQGPYEVNVKGSVVLPTKQMYMKENVTVKTQTSYEEIPNSAGGITVKIGG